MLLVCQKSKWQGKSLATEVILTCVATLLSLIWLSRSPRSPQILPPLGGPRVVFRVCFSPAGSLLLEEPWQWAGQGTLGLGLGFQIKCVQRSVQKRLHANLIHGYTGLSTARLFFVRIEHGLSNFVTWLAMIIPMPVCHATRRSANTRQASGVHKGGV